MRSRDVAIRSALALFVVAFGALRLAADESSVMFYGGAGRVGGSCALVENGGKRVLVDCGTNYCDERDKSGKSGEKAFGFDPRTISDLFLTHAHQDHAGRIPELVRTGFGGTLWMTEATLRLLTVLWKSQVKYEDVERKWKWSVGRKRNNSRTVHWREDCPWSRKIIEKNVGTFNGSYRGLEVRMHEEDESITYVFPCTTCQELELGDTLKRVKTVEFAKPVTNGPFVVTFRPVKHLPGSAAIYFSDGAASWVFSGDLGTTRSRLVERIDPAEKVDVVFVETTYGDDASGGGDDAGVVRRRFRQLVGAASKKGLAWIPAFALDRSLRILLEIKTGQDEGLIGKDVPIYYLSPSSRDLTMEYIAHPEWFDNDCVAGVRDLFKATKRKFDAEKYRGGSGILLTTSGMMDVGYSYRFLSDLVPREDVTVCLAGFQAKGTPGRKLKDGAKSIKLASGEKIDVGCRVESFASFGGHADAREIENWLASNWQSKIYLVHGDKDALKARQKGLKERFMADVEVAEPRKRYVMKKVEYRTACLTPMTTSSASRCGRGASSSAAVEREGAISE